MTSGTLKHEIISIVPLAFGKEDDAVLFAPTSSPTLRKMLEEGLLLITVRFPPVEGVSELDFTIPAKEYDKDEFLALVAKETKNELDKQLEYQRFKAKREVVYQAKMDRLNALIKRIQVKIA